MSQSLVIEPPIALSKKLSEDIIELVFLQENTTLDKMAVIEGWKLARELDPSKKSMIFLKTAKNSLLENDAREFVMEEFKSWPAAAILVHNLGQKLMGNFVINILGQPDRVKLFYNEEEGKEWLMKKVRK